MDTTRRVSLSRWGRHGRLRTALTSLLLIPATFAAVAATAPLAAAAGGTRAGGAPEGGPIPEGTAAACTVSALQSAHLLPGATVTGAEWVAVGTLYTPPLDNPPGGLFGQTSFTATAAFCAASLTQDDSAGNAMNTVVWLPQQWNGDFEGTGGGGFQCGPYYFELQPAMQEGYATAGTDCGLSLAQSFTGSFALNPNGTLNNALIQDFFATGIHDMSVDGEALTAAFYQEAASYRYFYGCSTGGREGLEEAQTFPGDYNGIASGSPAINWTQFIPAEIWPNLVMLQSNDFLPTCKETAFTDAAIAACADGSGVIEDPAACDFNPYSLVGEVTPCGTITRTDAAVVEKIWGGPTLTGNVEGPHLWYGLEPGASMLGLGGTTTSGSGVTTGSPFSIAVSWLGIWLQRNPSFDWQTLTYGEFDKLFFQSVTEFPSVVDTNNPNLSAFERDGGKLVIYHGLADQLIFPQGTIQYYQRVEQRMGVENTSTFARLFLAPGAQHCTGAAGPYPVDALQAVVNWVQNGVAPATLLAAGGVDPSTGETTQRNLCAYPDLSEYVSGDPGLLRSYRCVRLSFAQQFQLTSLFGPFPPPAPEPFSERSPGPGDPHRQ